MAEQLSTVANNLIKDAVPPADNDARRRSRIMDKMKELKAEIDEFHKSLEHWKEREQNDKNPVPLQNVLEDAEKRQLQNDQVKKWVVDIKDVYYTVIDVCKELIRMKEMQEQEGRNGLPLTCSNPSPQCRKQIRNGIPQMIDEISQKVKDLKEKKSELENLLKPKERVLQEPPTFSYVDDKEEPEIYSRSKEQRRLITWMHHSLDEVQLISVTGLTGIGKSALARRVYNEVKEEFNPRAWLNVSEEFNLPRIARDFVVSVTSKKINKMELAMESLSQRVRESIKGKKYLLVLDGLPEQKDFESEWKRLNDLFKGGGPGCVILVTTHQDHDVAKKTKNKNLPELPDGDCWSVIEREAFPNARTVKKEDTIKKIHDEVGKELVKNCRGLPVIAKALGVVLRGRTSLEDWRKVWHSDVWELDPKDKPYAMKATMLSYYFLPPELKQCLLYCSIFPKNHNIDVNQLINLWMAMDSIGLDEETMETKGRDLLKALLDRSIFQDYSQQDDSGSYACKLHGLMSDFIIDYLAQNECQIVRLNKTQHTDNGVSENVRHCTLDVSPEASLPPSISNSEKLHTLMVLSEYSSIEPENLSSLLSKMRRLRALVLSNCSMKELPTKACELWHLRYLDLSFNRDLERLPLQICNLFNLQTLNLNGCDELQELPKSIGKLTKLRHLDILWTTNLGYLPKGLTRLDSLTRLSRFFGSSGADNKACNLEDMQHLKKLQGYISIEGLGNSVPEAKKAGLSEKEHLCGIELWFSVVGSKDKHEGVLRDLGAPPQLECLGIFYYRGSSFPLWIAELGHLKHLILSDCGECDTLPALGRLKSLETLEMKNLPKVSKIGSQFLGGGEDSGYEFREGAFPKLQKLYFQKLEKWHTWEDPATGDHRLYMPKLTFLSIESCPKLMTLPNYITKKTGEKIDKPSLLKRKILWTAKKEDSKGHPPLIIVNNSLDTRDPSKKQMTSQEMHSTLLSKDQTLNHIVKRRVTDVITAPQGQVVNGNTLLTTNGVQEQ